MKRAEILEAAHICVCGEREQDYGSPEDSFGLIAQLWTAYMGTLFTSKDVAMMLALLKVARIHNGDKIPPPSRNVARSTSLSSAWRKWLNLQKSSPRT